MTTVLSPPQALTSSTAERSVLGALLLDPDKLLDVASLLEPTDFSDPVFRSIYAALRRLSDARQPIDFVTVAEALRTDATIEAIGGSAFLAQLASEVPTSGNV